MSLVQLGNELYLGDDEHQPRYYLMRFPTGTEYAATATAGQPRSTTPTPAPR